MLSIPGIPAGSEETTCCGQAKKQSSCCCCRVAGGLEGNTLWSASLCCCSVSSCRERHAADVWKTQVYLHSDTHFTGHPSCHGKTRLWQHSRDLALSTASFFSSSSITSHSPFPVPISKSQKLFKKVAQLRSWPTCDGSTNVLAETSFTSCSAKGTNLGQPNTFACLAGSC